MDIDFKPEFDEYFPFTDSLRSIFSYIQRNHKEISFPSVGETANEVLYSAFVLSPKSTDTSSNFTKLHQWILVLGSNTIEEFVNSIKCPLCELCSILAEEKKVPRKIETQEQTYYDFSDTFHQKIGNFITNLNVPIIYTSSGGCCHTILFVSAFCISYDSSIPKRFSFPTTIGGRAATPPFCAKCKVNCGTVAAVQSDKPTVEFYCLDCASQLPPERIIKDLNGTFFPYNQ